MIIIIIINNYIYIDKYIHIAMHIYAYLSIIDYHRGRPQVWLKILVFALLFLLHWIKVSHLLLCVIYMYIYRPL